MHDDGRDDDVWIQGAVTAVPIVECLTHGFAARSEMTATASGASRIEPYQR